MKKTGYWELAVGWIRGVGGGMGGANIVKIYIVYMYEIHKTIKDETKIW